ncbi:MAG TPA: FAD-binding oxidoreductase [Acidimicrobiales bacterium]|nr:FAD-binding oxidoreductase [Acidimicrobiales bacterium]
MTRPSTVPVPLADPDGPVRIGTDAPGLPDGLLDQLAACGATVDTDPLERAEWSRDWWPLALRWAASGQVPARAGAVVRPSSTEQVSAVLAACNRAGVPVTPAAGRSGVCGGSVPVAGGVVLDACGLDGIREVDDTSLILRVGAGTFGHELEAELRSRYGVTLGHWPQSVELSTVGGWLACRSAGQYSTRYGKIEDMVLGLEAVLADGTVIHTGGRAPRSAAGPDLNQLLIGSEGTLAVITEASLRVHPLPPSESRSAWSFDDFGQGLEACRLILRRGVTPAVLRLYDAAESQRSFEVAGRAVLIVLDEGDPRLVDAVMDVVKEVCRTGGATPEEPALVERWLGHRNDVSALGALVSRGFVVDTVEMAGRWAALNGLYRRVTDRLKAIDGTIAATAHQSHAYTDGACLYFTFAARPAEDADPAWGDDYYRQAWSVVMEEVVSAGAAVSHHHGIGLLRAGALRASLGDAYPVLASVKEALDPRGILNPGKLGLVSAFAPEPIWP